MSERGVGRGSKAGSNGDLPGSFSRLSKAYQASEDFRDNLKPRTQKDYSYYLGKIEAEFGHLPAAALSAIVIKTYYRRVRREGGIAWGYHIMGTPRACLSWGVSESWISKNYALDVVVKPPPKRKVVWKAEQAQAYITKATELGWHSITAMVQVFDSIGQSPVDVRTMKRKAYDGQRIDITRAKTGEEGASIPLFPKARLALNTYLATKTAMHPDAPLFTNDLIGGEWHESTLQKTHRKIRAAAGLPDNLQLQDFRTTVQTEGAAAGGTVDELRRLARHSTRSGAEHYVFPDARFVKSVQNKRIALRNKNGAKVRMPKT